MQTIENTFFSFFSSGGGFGLGVIKILWSSPSVTLSWCWREIASEKCVHEMSKVSLLIFDVPVMSKDAKMFKFRLSKRWQSCHFPNIKRCQDVNLLRCPTHLFYLKALVSFGGNPNLVHEKSSIFLEFILFNSFYVCPKRWPSIQDHKEKRPCPPLVLR